ncbi:hypothetical protein GLOIN_2v1844221 [Rhizophagus clarus]|uniref:RNase H type-1 domain-containing protein n=1 Tax=Rhizophagus clarus TaxID=94130 RepID=A0A8H3KVD8_9GLOM|nr:hypothetical protein GLOIN_2v1844221 [Rhizophagus clarus]
MAETKAFIGTLLIIPENKPTTIILDSEIVYNNFFRLTNDINSISLRDILKFSNNGVYRVLVKEILQTVNLDITLKKIKAHDSDSLHNELDRWIKRFI